MSATGAVEVRTISTDGAELAELVPEWDALARRCGRGFACRPSYALAWWRTLGQGSLAVVTAHRAGRLVAVAPLHRRSLLGQSVLRWLGHGLGTVGELVAEEPAAAAAVWDALAAAGFPLQLIHVRLDDPATLALRRSARWQVRLQVQDRCLVRPLPDGVRAGDLRGATSLKRLRGYRTALAREQRPFDLEIVDDLAGLRRRWPDIVRVAADADRGRDRDNLCGPPFEAFTLAFLEQEAAAGALLVVGVTVGGRWSAHEVGLRHGDLVELWLSRFDPALDGFSIGHQLMMALVDRHEQLGVSGLDFGLGENAYKLAWTDGGYDVATLTATVSRPGLTGARLRLARSAGDLARRVRR